MTFAPLILVIEAARDCSHGVLTNTLPALLVLRTNSAESSNHFEY